MPPILTTRSTGSYGPFDLPRTCKDRPMTTVGVVSPGFMGAGLGWALRLGGARVVATAAGRSDRTRRLAGDAGLELLPTLDDVVAAADVILSVAPPAEALAVARAVADAARRTGARPIFADLNAVSPTTMSAIAAELSGEAAHAEEAAGSGDGASRTREAQGGLALVDGAISGPA